MLQNLSSELASTDFHINKLLLREYGMLIDRIHVYIHKLVDQEVDRNNWEINYLIEEIKTMNSQNLTFGDGLPTTRIQKTRNAMVDFPSTNAVLELRKHEKDLMVNFFVVNL